MPPTVNPDTLAKFVLAILHGMAVQAKAGFSRSVAGCGGTGALGISGWQVNWA